MNHKNPEKTISSRETGDGNTRDFIEGRKSEILSGINFSSETKPKGVSAALDQFVEELNKKNPNQETISNIMSALENKFGIERDVLEIIKLEHKNFGKEEN